MAAARKVVTVFNASDATKVAELPMAAVFGAPIRPDVVADVHTSMAKNKRQAYAVSSIAGHQTSASSWGTGRAVSRIPRVAGGGTSRSGQGAFGNMCRGGRMFAPTKTWRKWHRKINVNQRRYAVASALAASAVTPLVMARGHRVEKVAELPLIVNNSIQSVKKTRDALATLARLGADVDSEKARVSKKLHAGKGKLRNRRYTLRRGPLVVYANDEGCTRAFRNLPGVELVQVDRLNLLQLAPGGHMGRFCIWTQSAFERLDALFGTYAKKSELKSNYQLPRHLITNGDIARVINSDEIQTAVRPAKKPTRFSALKKNALKNLGARVKLNPHHLTVVRRELKNAEARAEARAAGKAAARRSHPKNRAERKKASKAFINAVLED